MAADGAPSESKRQRLDRRMSSLKTERTSFEAHWKQLAENFMPRRGRFTMSDQNRGDKRHQQIIDATPIQSVRTLQAGMMSGLTSPARPWFRLSTPDPELAEFAAVKQWLHLAETRMRSIFARTNLYTSLSEIYGELGTFGTNTMLLLPDPAKVVRFMPFTVGQYWLAQDYTGRVDTLFRDMRLTVRQTVEEFGLEACSTGTQNSYRQGHYEHWVDIVNAVHPNMERVVGRGGPAGMAFASCYYETGANTGPTGLLAERGYRVNPILAARWSQVSGDTYGTSCPGMDALGDARQLQLAQKRKLQAIDKWIDPPLQAPSSLRQSPVSGLPGDVTFYDATHQGAGVRPLYDVRPDIQYLLQDMDETRQRLRSAFFADLFLMLANTDRSQMTAREVAERHEEKLLALGPVLERLNTEMLDPLIDATFDRMVELSEPFWSGAMAGNPILPPPPEELSGVSLKVEYISMLAQAQKMVGIGAVQQLTGYVGNLAAIRPEVLDKIDWDQTVDEMGEMLGVSPKLVVPDDVVAETRAARAEQQQAQQQAMAVQQSAATAKDLAQSPVSEDNALGLALKRMGAGI